MVAEAYAVVLPICLAAVAFQAAGWYYWTHKVHKTSTFAKGKPPDDTRPVTRRQRFPGAWFGISAFAAAFLFVSCSGLGQGGPLVRSLLACPAATASSHGGTRVSAHCDVRDATITAAQRRTGQLSALTAVVSAGATPVASAYSDRHGVVGVLALSALALAVGASLHAVAAAVATATDGAESAGAADPVMRASAAWPLLLAGSAISAASSVALPSALAAATRLSYLQQRPRRMHVFLALLTAWAVAGASLAAAILWLELLDYALVYFCRAWGAAACLLLLLPLHRDRRALSPALSPAQPSRPSHAAGEGAEGAAHTLSLWPLLSSSVRLLCSSGWLVRFCACAWLQAAALFGWASIAQSVSMAVYGWAQNTIYLVCAACATPALLCAILIGGGLVLPRAGPVPLLYWHAFAGLVACGTLPLAPFSPVALGAHFALLGTTAMTLPAYCQVLADRYPVELSQAHGVVQTMFPLAAVGAPPLASHLFDAQARGIEAATPLAVFAALGGTGCALLAVCAWEEGRRRATTHRPYIGPGSRFDLLSGDTALRTGGPFTPVKV